MLNYPSHIHSAHCAKKTSLYYKNTFEKLKAYSIIFQFYKTKVLRHSTRQAACLYPALTRRTFIPSKDSMRVA